MAYSDFKLSEMLRLFGLVIKENTDLFADVPEAVLRPEFQARLNITLPLALSTSTEKAREDDAPAKMYGVVTIGELWRFMELDGTTARIDSRSYHIERLSKIMGILLHLAAT